MLRLLALLLALTASAAAQESVVGGLSTDNIALTADFDGSQIFLFGAIRRDGAAPAGTTPLDIIITVKGPVGGVMVRRKERRFGVWINADTVPVRQAPSFYAIATTRPMAELLTETERLRYQIGMDQAVRRVGGHHRITDTRDFGTAVVRLREANGLYAQHDGAVLVTEDTLFQVHIEMPANLVEGDYTAEFFLVRDRMVISSGATTIKVEKTGIERWLFNLSQARPLAYGLMSVLLALVTGWLAAAVFRLLRQP